MLKPPCGKRRLQALRISDILISEMRTPRGKQAWLCFAVLTIPAAARTEQPSVIPLLTASDWRLESTQEMPVSEIRKRGGDPAIEREYGVKAVQDRVYRCQNKFAEALVEQTPDASAAFGLLTYYQTDDVRPVPGMRSTLSGPEGTLMARGPFFIRISSRTASAAQLSEDELRGLLKALSGTRPPSQDVANLPVTLPSSGLVPGSEKYLLGPEAAQHVLPSFRTDLIGFPQGAEVQSAAYSVGREPVTVLAISYPTPQIARTRIEIMQRLLGLNTDRGPQLIYGKRVGSFVILVLEASTAASATRVLDDFRGVQSVTSDVRYPGDKPVAVQLIELIIANFELVGVLFGLAILGGLMIVVSKQVTRRWFPKWPWGQPDECTIIRLGLS